MRVETSLLSGPPRNFKSYKGPGQRPDKTGLADVGFGNRTRIPAIEDGYFCPTPREGSIENQTSKKSLTYWCLYYPKTFNYERTYTIECNF